MAKLSLQRLSLVGSALRTKRFAVSNGRSSCLSDSGNITGKTEPGTRSGTRVPGTGLVLTGHLPYPISHLSK